MVVTCPSFKAAFQKKMAATRASYAFRHRTATLKKQAGLA